MNMIKYGTSKVQTCLKLHNGIDKRDAIKKLSSMGYNINEIRGDVLVLLVEPGDISNFDEFGKLL